MELKQRQYGESDIKEHIPGAEVLLETKNKKKSLVRYQTPE